MLLLNVGGGVALLLWATRMVRTGITRACGAEIQLALGRFTNNRVSSFGLGIGIAGLLQSSTGTVLLVVSFAGRGLLETGAGLALMLGADVGTTIIVQVLSFDFSWLSPSLILIGVVCFLGFSTTIIRQVGRVFIGLGLLLLSLKLFTTATEPLRDSTVLHTVLTSLSTDLILAVLLAALLTWLFHSSVAVVLLVMSLVMAQVVPLMLGFALVLGANVGSSIAPMVLTLSSEPAARRIPLGNLLFRLCGVAAVLPLIGMLAPGLAMLEADPSRQIANFHMLFNVFLALAFLPLTSLMARLTKYIIQDRRRLDGPTQQKYLVPTAIEDPKVAMACATREILRMADLVEDMLRGVIDVLGNNDNEQVAHLSGLDDAVDTLHEAIKLYLTQVSRNELDEADSRRCIELIAFTTNLEHIGDIIDNTLLEIANKRIKYKLTFSKEGWQDLTGMHARIVDQMQLSLSVLVSGDVGTARRLLAMKEQFRDFNRVLSEQHLERLRSGSIESIATSSLHLDILRDFKRISSHLTSVAYPILDAGGELRRSRLRKPAKKSPERSN